MKLLYIGQRIKHVTSGADQVNKRNQELLAEIFDGNLTYIEISVGGVLDKLVFGVNRKMIAAVKCELDKGVYTHLFISQSLMGRVAKFVKKNYSSVVVINFFHNIEVQYAHEYIKTRGLKAIPFFLTVKYWEKIGCKYSDKFITLNERDSCLLKSIYGIESSMELPTTFDDKFDEDKANSIIQNRFPVDYLFVGVAFFANIQGIQWFIDNVMPHLNGHLHIVGKGMDKVSFKNLTTNIHIYGFVDDLDDFYYGARMVVSPIFVGGGMKTKTAEALMYGKSIVGTEEAFEGYRIDDRCMYRCSTSEDFLRVISSLQDRKSLNINSRDLYNKYYSTNVALGALKRMFYD